jgi:CRISPR-associated protein Cmr2
MSDEQPQNGYCLLKLQIGPVQDFIAQARSTRDLWSGSYLISWLIAAGVRRLQADGGKLVLPDPENQPLLDAPQLWRKMPEQSALLTPNLPNLFVATIPSAGAGKFAGNVQQAIEAEWGEICEAVWNGQDFIAAAQKQRFDHQVKNFLSISWQVTPLAGNSYADAYKQIGLQLDAVRQTRAFKAWSTGAVKTGAASNKDSLSGKEEALEGGPGFIHRLESNPKYAFLFKHDDWIGAITLVKRLWHLAYLKDELGLKTGSDEFRIPSTLAIASKTDQLDDANLGKPTSDEKYLAVVALDGDRIGRWLDGEALPKERELSSHHVSFSAALSTFARDRVRPIVAKHKGFLIYAGGDDVLALLPADQAVECAQALRTAFRAATNQIQIQNRDEPLDASAGIAMAHFTFSLQDLVRAAQIAEQRAKNKLNRRAVAITLFKRSGETIEWGCKWEGGGLELFTAIADALIREVLSAEFTFALVELLQAYLTVGTPLMAEPKKRDGEKALEPVERFDVSEVIRREFAHVLGRQHGPKFPPKDEHEHFCQPLREALDQYLKHLAERYPHSAEEQLQDVIGLFRTVAFAPAQNSPNKGEPKVTP